MINILWVPGAPQTPFWASYYSGVLWLCSKENLEHDLGTIRNAMQSETLMQCPYATIIVKNLNARGLYYNLAH